LVGSDSVTDLAVIKVDAKGLTAAEFGSSDDLKVADTVMAIGNPGGLEFNSSVTIGYVSALNREITNSDTGYTMKCIQTDAAINPGNSGGALVNMYGQVVGINSSKIVATGYEGLGFSIPINVAQPIISDLKQYGYVKDRAVLGISGQFIDTMTSRFYNLPVGMYVGSVTNPEVTSAGIKKGDVITKIDGKDVTSQNVITNVITGKKPGDTVTLNVTSSLTGESFTAKVKLAQSTGK
ncbi:MAG: trypsin-like serine protease, partial [Ruminococcaceae bacterium]|nr:trypsin-like serine protease [Oscillospiraceae bacterium]